MLNHISQKPRTPVGVETWIVESATTELIYIYIYIFRFTCILTSRQFPINFRTTDKMRTEMWRAAHRLISHRSKNLCDPRWNPNFHNSIQSYSSGSIAICNFLFLDLNFSSAQGLFVSRYRSFICTICS